jgi:hypothetical protein
VPFPGLTRVPREGSGDYPEGIFPNFNVIVPIDGPSSAMYRSEGDQGRVSITATVNSDSAARLDCTADGNLTCRVEFGGPFGMSLRMGALSSDATW